jgi:hypothetical protein
MIGPRCLCIAPPPRLIRVLESWSAIVLGVDVLPALRRRMPLVAFVLLVVFALLLLGFACACTSDHPATAIERALSAPASLPPLIEVWSLLAAAASLLATAFVRTHVLVARGSPAELQRFLF